MAKGRRNVDLHIPDDMRDVVRVALEGRAREFEAPLPTNLDRPSNDTEKAWASYAKRLRELASKLR